MTVPQVVGAVAMKIHEAPPVHVLDPNPFGATNSGQTGGGKRLLQEHRLVASQEGSALLAYVTGTPVVPTCA